MLGRITFVSLMLLAVLTDAPVMAQSDYSSSFQPTETLIAKAKKKKKKKGKGKKKKGKAKAAAEEDMMQGSEDMGASQAEKGDQNKKFGIKAAFGYANAAKANDAVTQGEESGYTVELGFSYGFMGSLHYYFTPSLFALGEFAYGAFPITAQIPDIINGGTIESTSTISLMHFGGGAGYNLKFGDSIGMTIGAALGFSTFSATSTDPTTGDPLDVTGSGFSISAFANPYYAITPSFRVGAEPRIVYSMAAEAEEEDPNAQPTTTEEEDTSFGMAFLILVTAEFLF